MGQGIIDIINFFSKKKRGGFDIEEEAIKEMKKDVSQDEIDKILDKISESGYASLSKKEKEKLFNASKK